MGEACKWLSKLWRKYITLWEQLVTAFNVWFFTSSKMMTLQDNTQSFKNLEGKPIGETCMRFKKCPTHGLVDKVLRQYFYWSLDSINKGVSDQISLGGLMQQHYVIATQLLDGMTTISRAWCHIRVYPLDITNNVVLFED